MKKRPPVIRCKNLLAGGLFMRKKIQQTLNLLRIKD